MLYWFSPSQKYQIFSLYVVEVEQEVAGRIQDLRKGEGETFAHTCVHDVPTPSFMKFRGAPRGEGPYVCRCVFVGRGAGSEQNPYRIPQGSVPVKKRKNGLSHK